MAPQPPALSPRPYRDPLRRWLALTESGDSDSTTGSLIDISSELFPVSESLLPLLSYNSKRPVPVLHCNVSLEETGPSITMILNYLLPAAALLSSSVAAETTLGAFVFHRHGDRTTKAWAPTKLTQLGQHQVYTAGQYFREKYISNEDAGIEGISKDIVVQRQINVEAPVDDVLQNSAMAFLQSLYPPTGMRHQKLANGTQVKAPMNGYQLIPVNIVSSAMKSDVDPENVAWLQGISGCPAAIASSKSYFESPTYKTLLSTTKEFYQRLVPVISGTFDAAYATFENAYSVYDLINVATINNASIPSAELLDEDTLFQLRTLADQHQFGLAYNSSEPIRAIAGSTLAAQIVEHLEETIQSKSATKFGIQFGAYATFLSFFGLAKLPEVNVDFTGIVDYASSMTFELITEADTSKGYPAIEDISVRFLFSNGSAAYVGQKEHPLFGLGETVLPYAVFKEEMQKISIGDTASWCKACGVTTGTCAAFVEDDGIVESKVGNAMTPFVAGAIGALVALVALMGVQTLVLLVGGLKLVSKRALAASAAEMKEKELDFA